MAQALVTRARNRGRGRGRPPGGRNANSRKALRIDGCELLLECYDDDLTEAQKKNHSLQMKAYNAAIAQIKSAKKDNAVVKFFDTPLTDAEIEAYKEQALATAKSAADKAYQKALSKYNASVAAQKNSVADIQATVSQIEQPQQQPPSRRPQRKSAISAQAIIDMAKQDQQDDDDVIIVDAEPKTGPGRRGRPRKSDSAFEPSAAVNHGVPSNVQPSPQTMVLGNSMETNQPIALPPGVTFNNLAAVLAPNGVSVQYMYQTQQFVRGPQPMVYGQNMQGPRMPPPVDQIVPGTAGLGVKRAQGSGSDAGEPQPKRRQGKQKGGKQISTLNAGGGLHVASLPQPAVPSKVASIQNKIAKKRDEDGNWVPLDEYYYSKQEGDPAYREEKGEFRFKCWYCHKMLYNNVRIMMHMQSHIDNDKQQHLDLSDLTQCKHCYKQFDTPFEMQSHIEKVHQNTSNVLVCRICEKDHETQVALRQHMKASHNACEMPYICGLCNFRSSVYNDVVDHFKKRHDSSQFVLCLYCLKVFRLSVSKTSGWALTSNFYQHLQKHQIKSTSKKCSCCKLAFLNKNDARSHKQRDHLPNFRGALSSKKDKVSGEEQVMVKVPSVPGETTSNKKTPKSLNVAVTSKVQLLTGVIINDVTSDHICLECRKPMVHPEHFKKYVECSLCRYATSCSFSYSAHMMGFHSGTSAAKWKGIPRERDLDQNWYCLCGYSTSKGNAQAYHLVTCCKRTAYQKKPQQKFFEYDDEQEEFNPFEPYGDEGESQDMASPEKDIPSLFGALGLVRKSEKPAFIRKGVVAKKSTGGVIFSSHAKTSRTNKISSPSSTMQTTGKDSDIIPPELKGARKWSTVKIQDEKKPSKASVFLGGAAATEDSKRDNESKVADSAADNTNNIIEQLEVSVSHETTDKESEISSETTQKGNEIDNEKDAFEVDRNDLAVQESLEKNLPIDNPDGADMESNQEQDMETDDLQTSDTLESNTNVKANVSEEAMDTSEAKTLDDFDVDKDPESSHNAVATMEAMETGEASSIENSDEGNVVSENSSVDEVDNASAKEVESVLKETENVATACEAIEDKCDNNDAATEQLSAENKSERNEKPESNEHPAEMPIDSNKEKPGEVNKEKTDEEEDEEQKKLEEDAKDSTAEDQAETEEVKEGEQTDAIPTKLEEEQSEQSSDANLDQIAKKDNQPSSEASSKDSSGNAVDVSNNTTRPDITGNELSSTPSLDSPLHSEDNTKAPCLQKTDDKQLSLGASKEAPSVTSSSTSQEERKSRFDSDRPSSKDTQKPSSSESVAKTSSVSDISRTKPSSNPTNKHSETTASVPQDNYGSSSHHGKSISRDDRSSSSSSHDRHDSHRREGRDDYRKQDSRDRDRYPDHRRDDRYGSGHHQYQGNYRDDYRNRDNRYGNTGGYNRDNRYGGNRGGYQQHNRHDNRNNYNQRGGGGGGYYNRNDNYNRRGGWGRGGGGNYHGGYY